jgi:alpha-1,2-mannosyltransferase
MKVGRARYTATSVIRVVFYLLLGVAAVVTPIIMSSADTLIFYGNRFVYFGFCGAGALVIIGLCELRRRRGSSFEKLLPLLTLLFVSFYFLVFISEFSAKSFDYRAYEGAAVAVLQGKELYASGYYLYPPLMAQLLEKVYLVSESAAGYFEVERDWTFSWDVAFYLYQVAQYLLTVLGFYLCYRFARGAGLGLKAGLVLVTAVFILNDPLIRTLRYNQVNLWVLDLILLAVLVIERCPAVSGLAVSAAAHIKLYPLILLLPWTAIKRRVAVMWAVIGLFGITFIQTDWGKDWKWWAQYLAFLPSMPRFRHFRNNCFQNIVYHSSEYMSRVFDIDVTFIDTFAKAVIVVGTAAAIIWFVARFVKREKVLSELAEDSKPGEGLPDWRTVRLFSHTVDALALALLISPMAWEHHYVFALPIIIWAFATRGNDKPWQVGVAAFLILGVPTFDFFPFSFHRFLGLLLLVLYTGPGRLKYRPSGLIGVLTPARVA